MNKFLKYLFLFSIPFILLFTTIAYLDPYNFFHSPEGRETLKLDNGWLSYTVDYRNNKYSKIIFGSSRPNVIKPKNIPEKDWCKLSFGGATIPEYLKAFWFVAEYGKVKKVIIMTDVYGYLYSFGSSTARFDSKVDLIKHPYKYFTSSLVLESVYEYFKEKLTEKQESYQKFDDAQWQSELDEGKNRSIIKPSDPKELKMAINNITSQFKDVKEYCDKNNIEVKVVTPIISAELYQVFMKYAPDVYDMVLTDLVDVFGKVIDFGYPNDYTMNRANFKDPFHLKSDTVYINTLWGNDTNYCRIIDKSNLKEILNSKLTY
jgi:hypothetical protein